MLSYLMMVACVQSPGFFIQVEVACLVIAVGIVLSDVLEYLAELVTQKPCPQPNLTSFPVCFNA